MGFPISVLTVALKCTVVMLGAWDRQTHGQTDRNIDWGIVTLSTLTQLS